MPATRPVAPHRQGGPVRRLPRPVDAVEGVEPRVEAWECRVGRAAREDLRRRGGGEGHERGCEDGESFHGDTFGAHDTARRGIRPHPAPCTPSPAHAPALSHAEARRVRTSIHDLLAQRWSPRVFQDRAVAEEVLTALLEAARWSPSSYNEQPWRFLVGVKGSGDTWERLLDTLVEFNQEWARSAPVLLLAVASTRFERNAKENRHAPYDTGAACMSLSVEAQARGLAVHQMAGFDAGRAREHFSIPPNCEPMAALAVGYPGDPGELEGEARAREEAPRERRALSELAFEDAWGTAWSAIVD